MTSKRFIASVLLLATALCALVVLVNWHIDLYGLFGDVRGEQRLVLSKERQSKYLFSFNYIPSNFDALLVGSSISDNQDTTKIRGYRMYNASISGGNVSEATLVVENALARGRFKLILFCIHSYLVKDHGRKSGGMTSRDYWNSLGSMQLVYDYAMTLAIRMGMWPQPYFPSGWQDYDVARLAKKDARVAFQQLRAHYRNRPQPFEFNEAAYAEWLALVQLARQHGAHIVAFFPPIYAPRYRWQRQQFAQSDALLRRPFAAGEIIADFNDGTYSSITEDPESFHDGYHLSQPAADRITETLDELINGRPPSATIEMRSEAQ